MSVFLGQTPISVTSFVQASVYKDNRDIMQENIYSSWTRPEGWPDLDSLNLTMSGTNSFIYMTFRTGHIDDVCSFHINTTSGSATIELGTIENGIFTATTTNTVANNTDNTYWLTSNEGYSEGTIVIKVTGRISKFYLMDVTRETADGGGTLKYYMQPLLERIWYVPELVYFYNGSSTSTTGNGSVSLERDKIANDTGAAMTSMVSAWNWCYSLQSLDISGLSTPNVTNMSYAFQYCRKLEILDVSNLNTAKVTTMAYMFDACFRLKQLNLSNWTTTKLTSTGVTYMFRYCYALKTISGLENIYTNNLTSLASLFYCCYSLQDLSSIANWNIGKVTSLANTFYNCYGIKLLDISAWDVGKVTSLTATFYGCRTLQHINFPTIQTATLSGSQTQIFYLCYNLQEVNLSWIKPLTTAVTNISYMFGQCRSLTKINIPEGWNVSGCTASDSCLRIFADCYKLETITGISNWDMSGYNYSLAYSFINDFCLKELDIKNWQAHPTSVYQMFYECHALKEIDLTGWGWDKLTGTGAYQMFYNCYSVRTIKGIDHLGDAGNITSCAGMFNGCYSLTSLPNISSWDMAKVTTCANMFQYCYSLESLTITNWNLPKCTTIANMFRYCYHMKVLETTGWTLSGLTTNPDYICSDMYSLVQYSGLPIKLNHRYQNDISLPESQWKRIFTQLPTVSSKTFYMTTANLNRLTSTTKQIATSKGWTLTN